MFRGIRQTVFDVAVNKTVRTSFKNLLFETIPQVLDDSIFMDDILLGKLTRPAECYNTRNIFRTGASPDSW